MQLTAWNSLAGTVIKLAIVLLLFSDVMFLLSRAGIQPDNKAVRRLLLVREFSTPIGFFVVFLAIVSQLSVLALRLF